MKPVSEKSGLAPVYGNTISTKASGRTRWLAILLFLIVLASEDVLGLAYSVAPGLSAKNFFLYFLVAWICIESFIDSADGGFFHRNHPYLKLHMAFLALIAVAILSLVLVTSVLDYSGYGIRNAIFGLKRGLVDRYLMLFVFLAGITSLEGATRMLKAFIAIGAIVSAISLIDMFGILDLGLMSPRPDGRLQGPLGDTNDYAGLMAFLIPMAMALAYTSSGVKRLGWLVTVLLFALVLLYTASRGGLVGLIGGVTIAAFLVRRHINWRAAVFSAVIFLALFIAAIAILAPTEGELLYSRFIGKTQSVYLHNISSSRTVIWADGLAEMSATPISLFLGFGWDTWGLMNDYASHNEYLQWYFELGLLGLALFMFIVLYIPFQIARSVNLACENTRAILIGFLMGYLAILVVIFFLNPNTIWLYIWAASGLALRIALGPPYAETASLRVARADGSFRA